MNKAVSAIDKSGSFRVHMGITTDMVEEARRVHNTSFLGTAALGRVLTGTGLMGLLLKGPKEKLTVQFKGDGPAKEILATANGAGDVKGYISVPAVDLPLKEDGTLDVGGAIGIGTLTVIKDQGMKEPYMGRIDLVSGEVAEDLTAYYFLSEQQSSSVVLGVKQDEDGRVLAAGGMILQMLPDADPESVEALEVLLRELPSFSNLVEEATGGEENQDPETALQYLLEKVFSQLPEEYRVRALEFRDIGWNCDCSLERLEQVLLSIGEKDLRQLAEEDKKADLTCQFCTKEYHFDKAHMEMLLRVAVRSKEIIEKRQKKAEEIEAETGGEE